MKKVGIVTINDYGNYGNRLQNYALQEVIKNLGFDVTTIVNTPSVSVKDRLKNEKLKGALYVFSRVPQITRFIFKKKKHDSQYIQMQSEKIKKFRAFTDKYIVENDFVIDRYNIPSNFEKEYIAFVAGSDQIWNPNLRMNSPIDFLTFAPKHKRISYSASFGISKIPVNYEQDYINRLAGINHISVREEEGAKIVKQLIDKDVPVLIDPTLMLEKKDWLKISEQASNKPNGKYLLTYFLGEMSEEIKNLIKKISDEQNLEIVNLASKEDKKYYHTDPSEFIDYIKDSSIFLTDSFHGVIFSIIFSKPFVVFDRLSHLPSMNSRLDTLLHKFRLETRKWNFMKKDNNYFDVDFFHFNLIIEEERAKANNYLKKALEIEDAD